MQNEHYTKYGGRHNKHSVVESIIIYGDKISPQEISSAELKFKKRCVRIHIRGEGIKVKNKMFHYIES